MSDLENLSYEEKDAIQELQLRVRNVIPKHFSEDRSLLCKFLKARDFDVDKAETMIMKSVAWRKSFQVDTILQDFTPKPFFFKYPRTSDVGLDRDGFMVRYLAVGQLEVSELMKCATLNDYLKHWIWHAEEIMEYERHLEEKTGRECSRKLVCILNLEKLTLGNVTNKLTVDLMVRLLHILQDNYPECLKAVYAINSPAYYVFIYSIMKTVMSSAMTRKVHVFGYKGWQQKLLEVIDADVLPAFLGGNRTDPDGNPLCTSFVNHGGKISEKYYLPNEERDFKNKSRVIHVAVPPRDLKKISVNITEEGSRIQWEFFIRSRDVGFGLFYETSDKALEEILPIQRYETTDGTEVGFFKCQSTGEYIIVFDNTFSRLYTKEVEYCITVITPVI